MKISELRPREKGFVLWDHCQNLLDDPRMSLNHHVHNVSNLANLMNSSVSMN